MGGKRKALLEHGYDMLEEEEGLRMKLGWVVIPGGGRVCSFNFGHHSNKSLR